MQKGHINDTIEHSMVLIDAHTGQARHTCLSKREKPCIRIHDLFGCYCRICGFVYNKF